MIVHGLLICCLVYVAHGQWQADRWFNNVSQADGVAYGIHDNQGASMDGLHVAPSYAGSWYKYLGVYHTLIGSEFQVRLSVSADLLNWYFVRTLLPNADMPYIYLMGSNAESWIFLTHEQWMNPGSVSPSQLGFKMYYNESEFYAGNYAASFIAPLMGDINSNLMGTPNIYSAVLTDSDGYWSIDSIIGFHYHNNGVDQVMQAGLMGFSDPSKPPNWYIIENSGYEQSLVNLGVTGNIGQRDFNGNTGTYMSLQEGNIGPANPVDWSAWRMWLYFWSAADEAESYPGGTGSWVPLKPQTKGGSTSFGNPFYRVLPHPTIPGASVVATTYFVFSQGSAPGEAGSLLFYHLM